MADTILIRLRIHGGRTERLWDVHALLAPLLAPPDAPESPTRVESPQTVPWDVWGPQSTHWRLASQYPYRQYPYRSTMSDRYATIVQEQLHILDFTPYNYHPTTANSPASSPSTYPGPTIIAEPCFTTRTESCLPYRDITVKVPKEINLHTCKVSALYEHQIILFPSEVRRLFCSRSQDSPSRGGQQAHVLSLA